VTGRRFASVAALGACAAFLAAHAAAGPGTLDDIDAVNFAMGVREFDVARHQPHPPGYPLFIALAKAGRYVVDLAGSPATPASPVEARALAWWSILGGALAAFPLVWLFRLVGRDDRLAVGAMLLTLACPLWWVTASRPLSDGIGLAAALGVQAVLAAAFVRQRGWRDRDVPADELVATGRLVVLGACLAGLVAGLRSQTVWLTLPLLVMVIADRAGRGAAAALVGSFVTFGIGVLAWLVPLVAVTGGPSAYVRALTSQAGEDFEGVDMLLTSTQPVRRFALNLFQTFVLPWASLPLAVVVLALAVLGLVAMLRTSRRDLVLVAGLGAPYAAFHLVFQENVTTRYALPLVPMVCLLAVRGAAAFWGPLALPSAAALVVWSLVVAGPALAAYANAPPPVFRVFESMGREGASERPVPVVAMHRRVATETRRAREWQGHAAFPWPVLASPRGYEWLELVKYWRDGGTSPVWFLAEARRTDLALVDPASRRLRTRAEWPFRRAEALVGGARPSEMDWWSIDSPPQWFLGEGWAVTPETSGIAERDGKGPALGGATAWIRPRPGPARILIGGRNLGGSGAVRFTLSLNGRSLDTWDAAPNPGFFLRSLDLPEGSLGAPAPGDSRYAEVVVRAAPADASAAPVRAAVEQFNLQPPDTVMFGYDTGFHEDEYDPRTGLRWRWASDRADLRVWPATGPVRVRISVESPLKTFGEAPIVTLRAGGRELVRLTPRDAFAIDVAVSAADLAAADGRLTLTTTLVFVPADHVSASDARRNDRRRLGLRIFDVSVVAGS
jgi:hypothetical protein